MKKTKASTTPKSSKYNDVVGIDVGGEVVRCVRLVRSARGVEITAAAELPKIVFPDSADAPFEAELLLPKALAAPYAAFALRSSQGLMRLLALRKSPDEDESAALTELFGSSSPTDFRVGFTGVGEESPSAKGERLYVACALPDHLVRATASLLPEARRPAPASLQFVGTARLAAFEWGPVRRDSTAFVVHVVVEDSISTVAVFTRGVLAAFRQFPLGNAEVIDEVAQQFGLSDALAVDLLNENQIDPSSAVIPVLTPLFRQVALSTEFVARREGGAISRVFLSGVTAGISHWLQVAESTMRVDAEQWMPFDDYSVRHRTVPKALAGAQDMLIPAVGAARALMEDE